MENRKCPFCDKFPSIVTPPHTEDYDDHVKECLHRDMQPHAPDFSCVICGIESDDITFPEHTLKACRGCGTVYINKDGKAIIFIPDV